MSYTDLFDGYDEVEASQGFAGEPLPTDWYHLAVDAVRDVVQSDKTGAITARLQLSVLEGPKAKLKAFISLTLAPSSLDKKGSQRSDAEVKQANSTIQAQMKGFLRALNVTTGQPLGNDLVEKVATFYNKNSWEGRAFIGKITLRESNDPRYGPSNQLSAYHPLDDIKRGLDWYRNDHLVKTSDAGSSPNGQVI